LIHRGSASKAADNYNSERVVSAIRAIEASRNRLGQTVLPLPPGCFCVTTVVAAEPVACPAGDGVTVETARGSVVGALQVIKLFFDTHSGLSRGSQTPG